MKANGRTLYSDALIVCDRVEGPAGRHVVEQFWHPGEKMITKTGASVVIGSHSTLLVSEGTRFEVNEAWRSRRFGHKESTRSLSVGLEGSLPATMWAALVIGEQHPSTLKTDSNAMEAVLEFTDGSRLIVRLAVSAGGCAVHASTESKTDHAL